MDKVCLQACFSFRKRLYMRGLSKFTFSFLCIIRIKPRTSYVPVMNKAMFRPCIFSKADKHLCKRLVHWLNPSSKQLQWRDLMEGITI